jgi:predicted DNA-binding protein
VRKLRLRKGFWIILPSFLFAFLATPVNAATYTTYGPYDFYFSIEQTSQFEVRTYAIENGIDSMLWLYAESGQLITANDDFYGLDSRISTLLQPGNYRLRTGVCCGDPNRWYGQSYRFETNINGNISSGTTTIAPTTTETPTTTTIAPLPENSNWSMVNEGGLLELLAPEGFIFSEILFASYGTPVGEYGQWVLGNCHAENSLEIISQYALGNNTFSISADNSVFGDPCGGVAKRLAVTAMYAPAPSTTTTTIPTPETTTTTEATVPVATTSTTEAPVFVNPLITAPTTSSTTSTTVAPILAVSTTIATTLPPTTTTPTIPETTTTTIPIVIGVRESVSEVLNNLASLTPAAISNAINEIINSGINKNEALALSTQKEVLESISADQAKEIFASIDVSTLSQEEEKALVEALSNAPSNIKKEFENEIDIFGSGLDEYVPTGSSIDVGARRALIAVTTVATSITMTAPSSGGASSSSSGGSGASTDRSSSRSRRN